MLGDVFKQLIIREDTVKSSGNREVMKKAQSRFKKYLHYEEKYLNKKVETMSFEKAVKNTRILYSLVKRKRKR